MNRWARTYRNDKLYFLIFFVTYPESYARNIRTHVLAARVFRSKQGQDRVVIPLASPSSKWGHVSGVNFDFLFQILTLHMVGERAWLETVGGSSNSCLSYVCVRRRIGRSQMGRIQQVPVPSRMSTGLGYAGQLRQTNTLIRYIKDTPLFFWTTNGFRLWTWNWHHVGCQSLT